MEANDEYQSQAAKNDTSIYTERACKSSHESPQKIAPKIEIFPVKR